MILYRVVLIRTCLYAQLIFHAPWTYEYATSTARLLVINEQPMSLIHTSRTSRTWANGKMSVLSEDVSLLANSIVQLRKKGPRTTIVVIHRNACSILINNGSICPIWCILTLLHPEIADYCFLARNGSLTFSLTVFHSNYLRPYTVLLLIKFTSKLTKDTYKKHSRKIRSRKKQRDQSSAPIFSPTGHCCPSSR
ncbi:hypothetical protein BGW36DRAFT_54658 [Talaromyces proteolyticus]|uniref:Uncharacterized protein n=1 Tax=Talaromyces proteolyticus TaxID=1131652 RepID=A0AAD4KKY5_9EURO|nr:uncharacterized protein BGW36DRAFT_54658 [Talaromyces proteolyticus]KAH8691576.1 hypothetical protein BGW36DRAFT_54658 [Talaromyces proteolyticus]